MPRVASGEMSSSRSCTRVWLDRLDRLTLLCANHPMNGVLRSGLCPGYAVGVAKIGLEQPVERLLS